MLRLKYVRRMEEKELPKIVLYGELTKGDRNVGGQKKKYKYCICALLAKTNLLANWERLAENRNQWRKKVDASDRCPKVPDVPIM